MDHPTRRAIGHGKGYSPTPSPFQKPNPNCLRLTRAPLVSAIWIWPMTENEIRRLAHAVNDLRPDWPISSLTTFISNQLGKRAYRDAAVAMVWVAVDAKPDGQPASETPKRVLEAGPWWTAAVVDRADTRSIAPKRDEQCLDCGKPLTVCRTSVAACGQAVTRPTPAADPDRVATLAAAARAAITVDRDLFTDHPGDLEAQIQTQLGGTP